MAFDRFAADYSTQMSRALCGCDQGHDFFLRAKADAIVRAASVLGNAGRLRLLEIGCGPGLLGRFLAAAFPRTWGCDTSIACLSEAHRSTSGLRLFAADGLRTPFPSHSFDLVVASCVLHHVAAGSRNAMVLEMARLLRPGGLAVICEHNPWNPLTRAVVARCEFDHDAVLLSAGETRRRMRQAGLSLVRTRFILFFPWQGALWERVAMLLAHIPLGAQYVALGTRA